MELPWLNKASIYLSIYYIFDVQYSSKCVEFLRGGGVLREKPLKHGQDQLPHSTNMKHMSSGFSDERQRANHMCHPCIIATS